MKNQLHPIASSFLNISLAVVSIGHVSHAATSATSRVAQQAQHLVGEVTALDQASGQITVKTDAGASVTVAADERTTYRRLPPGQTSLDKAEAITRSDIKVGDRVLVPNGAAGGRTAARQVIVMAREAIAARRQQEREDWRARGVNGRVVAIDPAKKELTVEARARQDVETITVVASGDVKFRRYAPGSLRPADAVPGAFTDIRVGDQLRALGNRTGSRLAAEEIISGTVARLTGTVEAVDATRGEVTIKDNATGQPVVLAFNSNTTLRRIPAEYAETLRERREQRRAQRGEGSDAPAGARPDGARRSRRQNQSRPEGQSRDGQRQQDGQRAGGGGGARQMLENLPPITLSELKKGDAVMVTGTTGTDAARVTAATLITGDAEIIQRMRRFQRGSDQTDGMSPGLPGGVIGGGTGDRDTP
ncbi:MAG TPA: hypothetical protein VF656_08150 [Pyrinomonadaceae bacterium]